MLQAFYLILSESKIEWKLKYVWHTLPYSQQVEKGGKPAVSLVSVGPFSWSQAVSPPFSCLESITWLAAFWILVEERIGSPLLIWTFKLNTVDF